MQFGEERAHLRSAVRPITSARALAGACSNGSPNPRSPRASPASIWLRETNLAARRFYLKQGFAETVRIPGYYRGVETAVRMLRDVRVKL